MLDEKYKWHPFSVSTEGPVTLSILAWESPFPELDTLYVGPCAEAYVNGEQVCGPVGISTNRGVFDRYGNQIGDYGIEPALLVRLGGTVTGDPFYLPPGSYFLRVRHLANFFGPEFRYRVGVSHPP